MPKKILVPPVEEEWDEETETFRQGSQGGVLLLEHSLKAIREWESKWHKAYLGGEKKTEEESLDYIRFMIINDADPALVNQLSPKNIAEITAYLNDPATATTPRDTKKKRGGRKETVTAELIYYWMLINEIPFECETWPFNQLMMLLRVCEIKGQKPSKKSQQELIREHAAINARNKKLFNTKG